MKNCKPFETGARMATVHSGTIEGAQSGFVLNRSRLISHARVGRWNGTNVRRTNKNLDLEWFRNLLRVILESSSSDLRIIPGRFRNNSWVIWESFLGELGITQSDSKSSHESHRTAYRYLRFFHIRADARRVLYRPRNNHKILKTWYCIERRNWTGVTGFTARGHSNPTLRAQLHNCTVIYNCTTAHILTLCLSRPSWSTGTAERRTDREEWTKSTGRGSWRPAYGWGCCSVNTGRIWKNGQRYWWLHGRVWGAEYRESETPGALLPVKEQGAGYWVRSARCEGHRALENRGVTQNENNCIFYSLSDGASGVFRGQSVMPTWPENNQLCP